jgi:hypothetical protein
VGLAAFGALLAHPDPACWELRQDASGERSSQTLPDEACTGTSTASPAGGAGVTTVGGGSTSDVVVAREAVASAVLVAATIGLAWSLAPAPSPSREPAG